MRAGKGSTLESAVADMVGAEVFDLQEVTATDLDYDAFLAHRTLRRLSGIAVTAAGRLPWSLIEKTTAGPGLASAYLVNNGRRERAAYCSGLFDELPVGVSAPALHGVDERPDGEIVLRLEDVTQDAEGPTTENSIVGVARDLGRLSGTWLGRHPEEAWLFRGWVQRHAQPEAQAAGREVLRRAHPAALNRLGSRLDLGIRLIDTQPRIARLLDSLPQTLCHHDAVGANILRRDGVTVLIDWESVGPGAVGADLASLLFSSARRGDCSARLVSRCFDAAVIAYADGIAHTGANVDLPSIRRGVDAAITLRWKLLADLAVALEQGTPTRRGSSPQEGSEAAMDELVLLTGIMQSAADRVLDLGSPRL